MTFAPFGRIELKPLYEYLKVLKVKEVFLIETGKFQRKDKDGMDPYFYIYDAPMLYQDY